jgi:hypothetical protein
MNAALAGVRCESLPTSRLGAIDDAHHLLAIDGERQRLADALVVEGRALVLGQDHQRLVARLEKSIFVPGMRSRSGSRPGVHAEHGVEEPAAEAVQRAFHPPGGARHLEAVDVRVALAPVALVALHDQAPLRIELDDLEGAGADAVEADLSIGAAGITISWYSPRM